MPARTRVKHPLTDDGAATPYETLSPRHTVCLPTALTDAVSSCAVECVALFVRNSYRRASCSLTGSLTYLCTTENASNLTIGEGSLQCVLSNCPSDSSSASNSYNVCNGVPGSLPRTVGTITATRTASTSLPSSSTGVNSSVSSTISSSDEGSSASTRSVPSDISSIGPSTSSSSASISASSTVVSSTASSNTSPSTLWTTSSDAASRSVTQQTTPTSTSVASPTAVVPSANQASGITTKAVAGIAVAAVVGSAFVIGILIYLFCIRKRRSRPPSQQSQQFPILFPQDGGGPRAGSAMQTDSNPVVERPAPSFTPYDSLYRQRQLPVPTLLPLLGRKRADEGSSVAEKGQQEGLRMDLGSDGLRSSRRQSTLRLVSDAEDAVLGSDQIPPSSVNTTPEGSKPTSQDLPVLTDPPTARSVRPALPSQKSSGLPSLQLNTSNLPKPPSKRALIPMTPVYDNGAYSPPKIQAAPIQAQAVHPPEGNGGFVSIQETPETKTGGTRATGLRTAGETAGVVGPEINKKQSQASLPRNESATAPASAPNRGNATRSLQLSRSMSLHTEIDEDTTPEQETDDPTPQVGPRTPVKDLGWPQVPRSASIKRQAERPWRSLPRQPRPEGAATPARSGPMARMDKIVENSPDVRRNPSFPQQPWPARTQETYSNQPTANMSSTPKPGPRPYSTTIGSIPAPHQLRSPALGQVTPFKDDDGSAARPRGYPKTTDLGSPEPRIRGPQGPRAPPNYTVGAMNPDARPYSTNVGGRPQRPELGFPPASKQNPDLATTTDSGEMYIAYSPEAMRRQYASPRRNDGPRGRPGPSFQPSGDSSNPYSTRPAPGPQAPRYDRPPPRAGPLPQRTGSDNAMARPYSTNVGRGPARSDSTARPPSDPSAVLLAPRVYTPYRPG